MLAAEKQKARVWRDGEWRLFEAIIFQVHALSLTEPEKQEREEIFEASVSQIYKMARDPESM
jgi:hypothetical protein